MVGMLGSGFASYKQALAIAAAEVVAAVRVQDLFGGMVAYTSPNPNVSRRHRWTRRDRAHMPRSRYFPHQGAQERERKSGSAGSGRLRSGSYGLRTAWR